jgi:hypothetical protein
MSGWIAVFRAGRHTDATGQTREWTIADLDQIVTSYNPAMHEAPVVIGHPKSDDPAWAWVEALKRTGDVLYAQLTQVVPEFGEMLRLGLFKKRSVALYPPENGQGWRLRHLAFLGAQPPAVKGLEDRLAFRGATTPYTAVEFQEPVDRAFLFRLLSRLRDFIIDRFGLEAADQVVAPWDLESLQPAPEAEAEAEAPSENSEDTMTREAIDRLLVQAREEGKQAAQATFAEHERATQARLAELETLNRRQRLQTVLATLKRDGKLLPAWEKAGLMAFMEALEQAPWAADAIPNITFAEGEPALNPAAWFQRFLISLPKLIEFGEWAPYEATSGDSAGEQLVDLAYQLVDKSPGLDYGHAFAEVQRLHPELAAQYLDEQRGRRA